MGIKVNELNHAMNEDFGRLPAIPKSHSEEHLMTSSIRPSIEDASTNGHQRLDASLFTSKANGVPLTTLATPSKTQLLDKLYTLVRRHCVVTEEEAIAIVLWVMASWVHDAFRVFPRLAAISPEKRCGKSTLLEVIASVVRNATMVANASTAVLSRVADMQPTLLLDEADTFIKNGDPQLIGIINSGHSKATATVLKCHGDSFEPRAFSTWMPIVLASIGSLSDTIMDRSVVINLRRKMPTETVTRIPADIDEQCSPLRKELEYWSDQNQSRIKSNSVTPRCLGNDRAVDNWLPLFSVAASYSPRWLTKCEQAYLVLTDVSPKEIPTLLLEDIKEVFAGHGDTRISSADLVGALCSDANKPWSTLNSGKRLTPVSMAGLLSAYGVSPKSIRFSGGVTRGYDVAQFEDAFERYLT
jgi:hypothetical protein